MKDLYKLTVKGPNIVEPITLSIHMSDNAESIVRGLVHEDFEVTIFEDREAYRSQVKRSIPDRVATPADDMFED